MQDERLTFTICETCKILGIGRALCYSKVKTGDIPVIKIGRRLLVPRSGLAKLLSEPLNTLTSRIETNNQK